MPRCRHPNAKPSRFLRRWKWCPDCRSHVPMNRDSVFDQPQSEYERVAEHVIRDVLHWKDA